MAVKLTCPTCGATVYADDRFCGSCGEQQPGAVFTAPQSPVPRPTVSASAEHNGLLARLANATLGTYEIRGEIGRGGMAAVFYAHDLRMNRKVAIKVMFPDLVHRQGMVERFRQEARTAALLLHPNIIVIHSVEEREDLHYFVMSLVEGVSLADLLHAPSTRPRDALPMSLVQSLLVQTARALHYAHGEGVVHRDVSPANIMVSTRGNAIVTDFGIAKAAESPDLTLVGDTVGTPTYMSPEQCRGESATAASDQYSLGVVAFELLAGRPPFTAANQPALLLMHVQQPAPSLLDLRPDIPVAMAEAVMRMLAKVPAARWPSLRDALPAFAGGFDEHDERPREALARLVEAAGPFDRARFSSTPITPFPKKSPPTPPPDLRDVPSQELEVGATLAPSADDTAPLADRVLGWSSSDSSVATVAPNGAITALSPGTTVIYIELRSELRRGATERLPACVVTVVQVRAAKMVVSPAVLELASGDSSTLACRVEGTGGAVLNDRVVSWQSTNAAIATVDSSGVVTAIAPGRAAITAACDACTASATIAVTPARVVTVKLSANSTTVRCDERVTLTAVPEDARGRALLDRVITWSATPANMAALEATGATTASLETLGAGMLDVTARCGGIDGSIELEVLPPALAGLRLVPATLDLMSGDEGNLAVEGRDARGRPCEPEQPVEWLTATPHVVTVDDGGTVTAVAAGTGTITARADHGVSAEATVTVRAAPVASLVPTAPAKPLRVGRRLRLRATALDVRARQLEGRAVEWSTTTPAFVHVSPDGAVRALLPGAAEILAVCEGVQATTLLTVVAAPKRSQWLLPVVGLVAVVTVVVVYVAWRKPNSGERKAIAAGPSAAPLPPIAPTPTQAAIDSIAKDSAQKAAVADSARAQAFRDSVARAETSVVVQLDSIHLPSSAPGKGVLYINSETPLSVTATVDSAGQRRPATYRRNAIWRSRDTSVLIFRNNVAHARREGRVIVSASRGESTKMREINVTSPPSVVRTGPAQPPVTPPEQPRINRDSSAINGLIDRFAAALNGPLDGVLSVSEVPGNTVLRNNLRTWIQEEGDKPTVNRERSTPVRLEEPTVHFRLAMQRPKKLFGAKIPKKQDRRVADFVATLSPGSAGDLSFVKVVLVRFTEK